MNNNVLEDYPGEWWTVPTDSDDGSTVIFVTGRLDVEKFRNNPRFTIRIDVTLNYDGLQNGMPDEDGAETLRRVTDRLVDVFRRDPIAVLTGIYTGGGERNWIFYTLSTHIFQRKFNEALADLPLLPISISAENDSRWAEYTEMRSILDEQV